MARSYTAASSQRSEVSAVPVTGVPLTIACWARTASATADTRIGCIAKASGGNPAAAWWLAFAGATAGDPLQALVTHGSNLILSASTSTSFRTGTWHHCAGVFSTKSFREVYLDGGGRGENSTVTTTYGTPTVTLIGAYVTPTGTYAYGTGDVADFAVWNAALTPFQIQQLAKGVSPLGILPSRLVFYTPLVGNAATDIDIAGGLSLTLNGNPGITDHPVILPRRTAFANVRNQLYVAPAGGTFQNIVGRPFSLAGAHGLAGD